nr:nucleotidyltransferase domain-containing protein [Rhodoferax sp.]
MPDPIALRAHYRADKARVLCALASPDTSTRGVKTTLRQLSSLADTTLKTLWRQAGLGSPLALTAVGGFGRSELFPHSDVDVLVLLPNNKSPEDDGALKEKIETFIGSCWDAGLEIGSSVRSISECLVEAANDVTVRTALLESRLITGNAHLYADFQTQFDAVLN